MVIVLSGHVSAQDKVHTVGKEPLKIEGSIEANDPKVEVRPNPNLDKSIALPAKQYAVKLAGKTKYRLTMRSTQLDSVLVVQDAEGKQLAWDDDSGGKLDAQLDFTPPKAGTYKIFAAALTGTGAFTLTISQEGSAKQEPPAKVLDVGKGLKLTGTLGAQKKNVTYHVKLTEGKTYQIDMISADQKTLDPFLRLLDSGGKQLAFDDDGGEGLNARLIFRAPATATYQIIATSFGGGGQGEYTLEVREKE